MDVSEAPKATVPKLCEVLDAFINHNRHSRVDAERWLAEHLTDSLSLAQRVRSGHLSDDDKKLVTSFRLCELQNAKTAKLREIDQLDREAKKIASAGGL